MLRGFEDLFRPSPQLGPVLLWAFSALLLTILLAGGDTHRPGALDNDVANGFHIWADFVHRWLNRGVIPWWNPHAFQGYPVLEVLQTGLAYPPSLLVQWLFPAGLALNVLTAFHLILGMVGFHWFARRLGIPSLACALIGILYGCSGIQAVRVTAGHITVVAVLAWWPWALGGWMVFWRSLFPALRQRGIRAIAHRLGQQPGGLLGLSLAAGAVALSIRAGAPQYVAYLGYAMLFLGLADCLVRPLGFPSACSGLKGNGGLGGSGHQGITRQWKHRALGLGLALGLVWIPALGLSAPAWIPALSYLPLSARADMGGASGAVSADDARFALLETFLAFPLGDDVLRPHLGRSNVWETSTYHGIGALALTSGLLLALVGTRLRGLSISWGRVARAGVPVLSLLILSAVLIEGWPLPGLSRFRDPLKARQVGGFALCLGTGAGLALWFRYSRERYPWLVTGFLLPSLPLLTWLFQTSMDPAGFGKATLPNSPPFDLLGAREFAAHVAEPSLVALRVGLSAQRSLLFFFALILLLIVPAALRRRSLMVLPVTLILADALPPHAPALLPLQSYATNTLSEPVRAALESVETHIRSTGQPYRVTLPNKMMNRGAYLDLVYDTGGYDPLMPRFGNNRTVTGQIAQMAERGSTTESAILRRGIASKAIGRRYDWLTAQPKHGTGALAWDWSRLNLERAFLAAGAPEATIFELTRNVVSTPRGTPHFGPDEQGRHVLHDHPNTLPLPGVEPDGSEQLNPRARAAVEQITSATTVACLTTSTTLDRESHWRVDGPPEAPHHLRIRFDPPPMGEVLLLGRITWLPGWRYQLNEGPVAQPLLANGWALGIPITPGTTQIDLIYEPPGLETSRWLTVATVVVLGLGSWTLRRFAGRGFSVLP
jgi:hypothetical protein